MNVCTSFLTGNSWEAVEKSKAGQGSGRMRWIENEELCCSGESVLSAVAGGVCASVPERPHCQPHWEDAELKREISKNTQWCL